MEIAVWMLTLLFTLTGLLGVLVPLIPGTTLILFGFLIHKLLLPGALTWVSLAAILAAWLLSVLVDFAGVIVGTRLFGGSKWGMAGASGGAFIGMFFSLPALILGTIFGAAVAERYAAKRTHQESIRAGFGAAVGFVLSTVGRMFCALTMVALFIYAVEWPHWPTWFWSP